MDFFRCVYNIQFNKQVTVTTSNTLLILIKYIKKIRIEFFSKRIILNERSNMFTYITGRLLNFSLWFICVSFQPYAVTFLYTSASASNPVAAPDISRLNCLNRSCFRFCYCFKIFKRVVNFTSSDVMTLEKLKSGSRFINTYRTTLYFIINVLYGLHLKFVHFLVPLFETVA